MGRSLCPAPLAESLSALPSRARVRDPFRTSSSAGQAAEDAFPVLPGSPDAPYAVTHYTRRGFVLAFLFALANRLRISPLVGYLLAGVLAGPFTPGYVADQALSQEIAELGVILLMFGVGLHFSLRTCSR